MKVRWRKKNEGIKIRRDWRNGDMLEITNKKRVKKLKKKQVESVGVGIRKHKR